MNPRAETRLGPLRGATDETVLCFRSVPYALPPVGRRRWRPPEPPEPWPGTLDARRFGPAAPQLPRPDRPILPHSEDCLTLNVWTPAIDGALRPVLVFVHGGEFTRGGAAWPEHDPTRLARRGDAVVVTVQYRLGALGFLALAEPEGSPNLGLLDQIAALRLIKSEIDAFGGDPGRVTLFGSGAGATSALILLAAGLGPELFQRAILQGPDLDLHGASSAAEVREHFLEELARPRASREMLEAAPLEAILRAQRRCEQRFSGPARGAFRPAIDGKLIASPPLEAIAAGSARAVTLLAGDNDLEPGPDALVPAMRVLTAHVQSGGRAFAYRFCYRPPSPPEADRSRAEIEVPFVMGTLEASALGAAGASAEAKRLARTVQDAWLAFARSGEPGQPMPAAWPALDASSRRVMALGQSDQAA